jgi:hypothetical protein
MRKKISAIRVRNANLVAASLCEALVARKSDDKEKAAGFRENPAAQFLRIQLRLFFDYHTLDRAMLRRSGVINTNPLAGSQWRCHGFAGRVNNVRSRA